MRHYQRALSTINRNIVGAHPYPGAVNKWPALSEKFVAKMAGKQKQPLPEETKKVVQSLPVPTESRDCRIIDMDDYKITGDSPVPMFVQHTKANLEEIDRIVEVEMEDTTDEPVDDIESSDKWNPLAVVEYIDDIYAYYKKV